MKKSERQTQILISESQSYKQTKAPNDVLFNWSFNIFYKNVIRV